MSYFYKNLYFLPLPSPSLPSVFSALLAVVAWLVLPGLWAVMLVQVGTGWRTAVSMGMVKVDLLLTTSLCRVDHILTRPTRRGTTHI